MQTATQMTKPRKTKVTPRPDQGAANNGKLPDINGVPQINDLSEAEFGRVYCTYDTSMFYNLKWNRKPPFVKRLAKRIYVNNKLPWREIEVTRSGGVIDGQRRKAAVEWLEENEGVRLPIYFIRKDVADKDVDGNTLSTIQQGVGWKSEDFLRLHVAKGQAEYIKLNDFFLRVNEGYAAKKPLLTLNQAIVILHDGKMPVHSEAGGTRKSTKESFQVGEYQHANEGLATRIVEVFKAYADCRQTADIALKRQFQACVAESIVDGHLTPAQHLHEVSRLNEHKTTYQHMGRKMSEFGAAIDQFHNFGKHAKNHSNLAKAYANRGNKYT